MTSAKRIIEQETQTSGDIWRDLDDQTSYVADAVQKLKSLVPGFEDALDSIVAAHKAKVDLAYKAIKKTKVEAPNKMVSSVLSGDPLGEKEKDPKPAKDLLKVVNKMGWKPKFRLILLDDSDFWMDEIVESLNRYFDIEVEGDDLLVFQFNRWPQDRDELADVVGAILPNGQIFVAHRESDRSGDGPYLYNNVEDFVDGMWGWDT